MKWIIYSRYGRIQGIVKNMNNVFFTCHIMTTGVGEDPIRRCDTKEEALQYTDEHFDKVAQVKFAGLLADSVGDLD